MHNRRENKGSEHIREVSNESNNVSEQRNQEGDE